MRLAIGCVVASGCLASSQTVCNDGTICPEDRVCIAGGCALHEQLVVCDGQPEGAPCTYTGASGKCMSGVCIGEFCGDGLVTGTEQCDGSNLPKTDCTELGYHASGPLACTPDCTWDKSQCTQICGDGILDPGEQCDGAQLGAVAGCTDLGFYDPGVVTCNALCHYDTSACTGFCGDGIKNGPEFCDGAPPTTTCLDYGYDVGLLGCSHLCAPDFAQCESFTFRPVFTASDGLNALWGSGETDVFAVGSSGLVVHFNGSTWSPMTSNTTAGLTHVWGTGPHDVFAVGGNGTIIHYDGSSWSVMGSGVTTALLLGVWGSSPTDVFAIGPDSHMLHFNGATWSSTYVPDAEFNTLGPGAIWGSGPSDVYAGGNQRIIHYDGSYWSISTLLSGYQVSGIWGSAPNDVYAIADSNAGQMMFHFDGAWSSTPMPATALALSGIDSAEIYAAGDGTIMHYDHDHLRHWSMMMMPPQVGGGYVWGNRRGDVYALANPFASGGIILHGGASVAALPDPPYWVQRLRGNDASDVFGIGGGLVTHYDGTAWSTQVFPGGSCLDAVGVGGGRAFAAAGSDGLAFYDGATWTVVAPPPVGQSLYAIWASSATDVFAVGSGGAIVHWNGAATEMVSPTTDTLFAVWGSGPNDVYAGTTQQLIHYDGAAWTIVTSPAAWTQALWGSGPDDVYSAGDPNGLLHWDGVAWTRLDPSTAADVVWGSAADDVYSGSWTGSHPKKLRHWNGAVWEPVHTDLQSVVGLWGDPSNMFFVGRKLDGATDGVRQISGHLHPRTSPP